MKEYINPGFDTVTIADYQVKINAHGKYFWPVVEDNSEEYFHFYFIGQHEGKEVIYDACLYTLRLQHESELYEIAEHRAALHFPQYKKLSYEEDENGNLKALDAMEEEIGLYMAEVILELQEEEEVKVQEHVMKDEHAEFGIGLDVGLHIEQVTPNVIEKFILDFNAGKLVLDDTMYSFQTEEEEA